VAGLLIEPSRRWLHAVILSELSVPQVLPRDSDRCVAPDACVYLCAAVRRELALQDTCELRARPGLKLMRLRLQEGRRLEGLRSDVACEQAELLAERQHEP
jgi:hypothetical protein